MGNRATVIFTNNAGEFSPSVYLHWNGGAESVYGFLEELNRRKIRGGEDLPYECARFIQLVGEFFDQDEQSGLSLGVVNSPASDKPEDLAKVQTDLGDNGIYLVNRQSDGTMHVRRFTENWEARTVIELSEDQVTTERNFAYKHKYGLLKDSFLKIANGRKVNEYA